MTLITALFAWLALNYAVMTRLSFVAWRRGGLPRERALVRALAWPIALLQARRA